MKFKRVIAGKKRSIRPTLSDLKKVHLLRKRGLTGPVANAIVRLLWLNPGVPAKKAVEQLAERGINTTSLTVDQFRSFLGKSGLLSVNLKKAKVSRLNSVNAKVRRALIENKGKKTVRDIITETGATKSKVHYEMYLMRSKDFPIELKKDSRRIFSAPILPPKQKSVLLKAEKFVSSAVSKSSSRKGFSAEDRQEFASDVDRLLPLWIKTFIEKGDPLEYLGNYVFGAVSRHAIDFDREKEMQETGLSKLEVQLRRSLESRIAKQKKALQKKVNHSDLERFFKKALTEVNSLKYYKKNMAKLPGRFPSRKLSPEHAEELLKAGEIYRKQLKVDHERREEGSGDKD